MLCKKCNIIMGISGTLYEPRKNKNDKGYKRYGECPKCHCRKYHHNSPNFQEVLTKKLEKQKKNIA